MRKFILTSAKIEGQIEVVYDEKNDLSIIDFSKANMNIVQKDYFLKHVNVSLLLLEEFVKKARLTCVESEIEITFEMFWGKYGFKVDRKRALSAWEKLPKTKQALAFYGIDRYFRYLSRTDWRNKMEPKTYLKNERWEDEWK